MPSVSGRFVSAVKYFTVCGLPSSRDIEVVLGKVRNERAVLVFDVEEKLHDVDVHLQSLGGLLRVVWIVWSGLRLLALIRGLVVPGGATANGVAMRKGLPRPTTRIRR